MKEIQREGQTERERPREHERERKKKRGNHSGALWWFLQQRYSLLDFQQPSCATETHAVTRRRSKHISKGQGRDFYARTSLFSCLVGTSYGFTQVLHLRELILFQLSGQFGFTTLEIMSWLLLKRPKELPQTNTSVDT